MAVEQRRYTPTQEQAARTFFEGLTDQPSLTNPRRTVRELVREHMARDYSASPHEDIQAVTHARLRREPGTEPIQTEDFRVKLAYMLESNLPMDEAIDMYTGHWEGQLTTAQRMLTMVHMAPSAEDMRDYLTGRITEYQTRLTELRDALNGRRTEGADTY